MGSMKPLLAMGHPTSETSHPELDVLGRRRAGEQQQQVHQMEQDQVEQTQGHGSRSCRGGRRRSRRSETQADFWNPAGHDLPEDEIEQSNRHG